MNDRWERLIDLYHSAVSLPADERASLLTEECGDDPALRADVERMIVAHHRVSRPTGAAAVIDAAPPAVRVAAEEPPAPPPSPAAEAQAPPGIVVDTPEGEPLETYANTHELTITERLELFLQLCNTVDNAHRRGTLYGELTPTSVLVTAAGVPTLPDAALGDDATTAAQDIQALGLILDQLLGTGVTTSTRRPLRRELDGTVLKALRKDGQWRYDSVEALAGDIRRQLDSPPARERREARRARPTKPRQRRIGAIVAWTVAAGAAVALGIRFTPLMQRGAERVAVAPPIDPPPVHVRLAIGELEDRTGDRQLAAMLSNALRTGITESPTITVVSTGGKRGVSDLTGTVERTAGGAYVITAQLWSAQGGEPAKTLQETAADSNTIIPALSRLSQRVRGQLGESATSIAATPRLEDVTTASLTALRAFANGSAATRAGDRTAAVRWFRAAVAADSSYASAYRLLGFAYRDAGDRARSRDALDRASANQERLTFNDRNQAIASYAMNTSGDYAAAVDAYNRLLSRDPGNARVLSNLSAAHAARREYAAQESLLVRAIAVDSDAPSLHTGLAMAAVNQGKYDDARRVLDRAEQKFPGLRSTQLARVAFAASQQDWIAAEREARETAARASADSVDGLAAMQTLGTILMTRGRLAEAEQELRRVIALGVRRGAGRQTFAATLSLAYLELRYRHSPAGAVSVMNATLTRLPLAKMDPDDRPYEEVARLFADAGQPTRAAELMAQAARARGLSGADAGRRWTSGAIAMAERRAWEGEIEIQGAANTHPCPICALPDLARAYEVAGKPDSASATYERYLHAPWQRRFETDAVELGFAMKRLGELYQQQNDRAKAAAQYTALLQLWQGADAELAPLLADVRRRLEQTSEIAAR